MISEHARSLPIFWGHGTQDTVVPYELALSSIKLLTEEADIRKVDRDRLEGLEFRSYEGMTHTAEDKEIDDFRAWLKRVIPKNQ